MKFTFPGLSEQEVQTARAQHGTNTITNIERETFWDIPNGMKVLELR
jgi:hypothetical protein